MFGCAAPVRFSRGGKIREKTERHGAAVSAGGVRSVVGAIRPIAAAGTWRCAVWAAIRSWGAACRCDGGATCPAALW
jgi:hypothetical protein